MPSPDRPTLSRRRLLATGGAAAAAVVLGACDTEADPNAAGSTGADPTTPPVPSPTGGSTGTPLSGSAAPAEPTSLSVADFADLPTCVLQPEQPSGPFPSMGQLVRRDITDGVDGHPMQLGLRVVDGDCAPIAGALVDVWHTDATGDYSQYADGGSGKDEAEGTTFCRGVQTTDDDGIVEFLTVYPGWYPGRAVHVHLTVLLDERELLTTQLYFDDDYSREVYASGVYAAFGPQDVTNAADFLAGDPSGDGTLLALTPMATGGTRALVNLGVPT